METVNLQVVVRGRTSKVVDKSRPSTLVSPIIEGDKKKKIKKTKIKQTKIIPKKGNTVKSERITERVIIPLTQSCPNPVQNMYPRYPIRPPAPPFPVIPAGAPPVMDPITKQVYMPAFIPVPPGAAAMGQAMPMMPPFPGQQVEGPTNILNSDLKQGRDERERYDNKRDDRYHSSELDYFLGGTAQYLNEKSQRKRSRSFSNRTTSSTNTRSDKFGKRRRYSPDRKSRSSMNRSRSYRSYERDKSPRSRRYSNHSGSRSGSIYGSQHYSRSPFRSLSRDRSLSPPIAGSCHLKSNSRSPVSENSFRGSFLTVSEANSRDSVRDRSRERSRSHYSDQLYVEEPFFDAEQVSDNEGNYSRSRYSDNYISPQHSYSPERDQFWSRPPSHDGDWRDNDKARHISPEYDRERYSHRSPEHSTDRNRHRTPERNRERHRYRTPEYKRVITRNRQGEKIHYIHHYERVEEKNPDGESIRYIRKTPYSSSREQRHHSHRHQRHDDVERVSDFEDVSDFEEVTEFEEVSENEGSVIWVETQSDISYEVISDTEEPVLKDGEIDDKNKIIETGLAPEDLKYDGYLNPNIHQPVKENELEEVSDNEMQFNDTDPHVKEGVETKDVSASATAFIKDILAGLPSNNTNQQSDNPLDQTIDHKVTKQEASESAGDWNAVTGSAIQVYANLGLMKDENNKLVYVGQGDSNAVHYEIETTLSGQSKNAVLDESFQGYVKTLWLFPHKGILHMSYTNFIDESEAYKDELIAEIIHIILRLDLPYVTLNKLRNAIRENIKIQLSSVEELRQILILYPKHFVLSKHAGSDSEDDEDPEIHTSKIRVNVKVEIRLCERHKALPYSKNVCPCDALHICPFYLLSNCNRSTCSLGHDLKTQHNAEVINEHRLHRATLAELVEYLRNVDHRNIDTVPTICKFFNRRRGCAKESETDDDELCLDLHLCFFYVMDTCRKGEECELAHDFNGGQPLILLKKFGLDPEVHGEFNILSMLRSSLRARRQVLDTLNEKIADKSLTDSELKLCIARGINPKLLQMTKGLRFHPIVASTVQDVDNDENENQDTSKQSSPGAGTTEDITKKLPTPLSFQMEAQKALIEKALMSLDDEQEFTSQNGPKAVIPIICKFYNNETGCARSNEYCEFIHVCHHYVMGDCKYYDRCKRSHDLTSGQPEYILSRLGIVDMSENEILKVLRKLCGETLVGVDM